MSVPSNVSVDPNAPRYTGCVKWFDNRKGFGFVNKQEADGQLGGELFVHHSCLVTKGNCFRTLYPGEYVQFYIYNDAQSTRDFAVNVTGINGGSLQCENTSARLSVRRNNDGFQNVESKGRSGGGKKFNGRANGSSRRSGAPSQKSTQ
jgi:CspA family cold shock protein